MPSAADGGKSRVVLGHDHQRHAHRMIEAFRAPPVAGKITVPADAAGEAGLRSIDEHLLSSGDRIGVRGSFCVVGAIICGKARLLADGDTRHNGAAGVVLARQRLA